ncbi:hypothetical protein ACPV3Y_27280, partial [Vibrio maritimus]
VSSELQALERQYFPDTVFPSAVNASTESEPQPEAPQEGAAVVAEPEYQHAFADMVREKWPELTETQVENFCEQCELVITGFGETPDSAKPAVQCMINAMRKPSTVLRTIRVNYEKAIA